MKSNKRYTLDDCKNILGKNNKTIFIGSAKFWREFEEAVNSNIIDEQTLGTKIENKDYRVFQTEFGEIKIKDEIY